MLSKITLNKNDIEGIKELVRKGAGIDGAGDAKNIG